MKIILLTTNTYHHKYLIKEINSQRDIELFIFLIQKKNERFYAKNKFEEKEIKFEKKKFFKNKKYYIKNKTFYFNNVNSKKCIKSIKQISPDLGILFGTKKVSLEIIKSFQNNLINVHRGVMEKYRGLDSEYWALYKKDFFNLGSTIHYVNKHLDKGKIIYEKKLKIKKNFRCFQLRYHLTVLAVKYLIKLLVLIKKKKNIFTFKNQKIGQYYSYIPKKLKKEACENLLMYAGRLK